MQIGGDEDAHGEIRELPMVDGQSPIVNDGPNAGTALLSLTIGNWQLIIDHFQGSAVFQSSDWPELGGAPVLLQATGQAKLASQLSAPTVALPV